MTAENSTNALIDFEPLYRTVRDLRLGPRKGTVVHVSGLIVESSGPAVGLGQNCLISLRNGQTVDAEVVGFRKGGHIILLPLDSIEGIRSGDSVIALETQRTIPLDVSLTGRVLDGLGRPIDNKGPVQPTQIRQIYHQSAQPLTRKMITQPLPLGIRSIDGLLTCGKGQRVGVFSGSGVGKSVLLGEIANSSDADINVVALVGERGREVREFLEKDLGPEGMAKSVVVVATSDAAAIQRVKAPFVAVTIAEYFRDLGFDVLFMMDSLTRFAQAQREIGLAAGEPPAAKGYCPSVFHIMPHLLERLSSSAGGTITGILTVLAESDDLNDPVADSARSLLDGHIVLARKLADRGHYPAVDILQSVSRLMNTVVSEQHRKAAQTVREIYATYTDAEDLINIGALSPGANKRIDGSVALIDRIHNFLVQSARQKTSFEQTVKQLTDIAENWNRLLADDGTKPAQKKPIPALPGKNETVKIKMAATKQ